MINDLIAYYQGLLIIQYHENPNARAEIKLATETFTGDDIFSQIVFDVDTSVGVQLDLIGKIVGLSRIAEGFTFANIYYSYNDYADPMTTPQGKGMSDIGSPVEAIFKDYESAKKSIYSMTDGQYRKMIKLKIILNNAVATNQAIDDSLFKIFGNSITIVDNLDMTETITVQPSMEFEGRLAEYLNLFPRPLGVGLTVNYV